MAKRIQINVLEPKAFEGMFALEKYLEASSLQASHKHLVKIRASQINGCAFCINMHSVAAIQQGANPYQLLQLDAWPESPAFTSEERLILQLTEDITRTCDLSEKTYQAALSAFGETYLAQLIMVATNINAWNRIAKSTRMPFELGK